MYCVIPSPPCPKYPSCRLGGTKNIQGKGLSNLQDKVPSPQQRFEYDTVQNCLRRTCGLQYWSRPMIGHGQVAWNSYSWHIGHPTIMNVSKHDWYLITPVQNHGMKPEDEACNLTIPPWSDPSARLWLEFTSEAVSNPRLPLGRWAGHQVES